MSRPADDDGLDKRKNGYEHIGDGSKTMKPLRAKNKILSEIENGKARPLKKI